MLCISRRLCPSIAFSSRSSLSQLRRLSRTHSKGQQNLRKRYRRRLGVSIFCVCGATLFLAEGPREKAQYVYLATQRTGRVLTALLLSINDYRTTLKRYSENETKDNKELDECHERCAQRTRKVMEANGSIFIKLGQHLSSLTYLLPSQWTTTFIPLQDQCPVSSYASIEKMFLEDLDRSVTDIFYDFDPKPIGAASLAQVHLATLRSTGERVAVKVQHPVLKVWVPLDLFLTRLTFTAVKYFFPDYDFEWLSEEIEKSLPQELDFVKEGEFAMRTKHHFARLRNHPLVIPQVKEAYKRILVMEYLPGQRTDNLDFLDENKIDRDEVSASLARIFNEMIFGDTPLHCDPHGGNIAIRKGQKHTKHNFELILYDHGLYRDIPVQLRRDYAKLWLAVIDADEPAMREYSRRVAGITDDQFPLFASAITGRDYMHASQSVVSTRSQAEKEAISEAMGETLVHDLVKLLGQVPSIMLLILKTNDLTRSLDENLHTREGPMRNFLILAQYCSKTVLQERLDDIRATGGFLRAGNIWHLFGAWSSYMRVGLKLSLYTFYLKLRRFSRLSPIMVTSI